MIKAFSVKLCFPKLPSVLITESVQYPSFPKKLIGITIAVLCFGLSNAFLTVAANCTPKSSPTEKIHTLLLPYSLIFSTELPIFSEETLLGLLKPETVSSSIALFFSLYRAF